MKDLQAQFVQLEMPDGTYHVSREFLLFKQLQACNGREYSDGSELIDDYRKYLRLMEHFDSFEQEEAKDINGKYPSYPLLARVLNYKKMVAGLCIEGKPIPYRVLDITITDSGNQEFTLASHHEKYATKELDFFIKTPHGLVKLH